MKVWYVCRSRITRDYGASEDFILFSTQEKAVEKFMELVESEPAVWVLKNTNNKILSAYDSRNVEKYDCRYLDVGSYEIDSGEILES